MNNKFLADLNPKNILFYARNLGMIGDNTLQQAWALVNELFPVKTGLFVDYEYWLGQNVRATMATMTAFDVEAPLASRQGISAPKSGELPKIQRKLRLTEKEKILLLRIAQNAALPAEVRQYIMERYNDVDLMRDAVLSRMVYFVFQALTTMGALTVNEGGVNLTVDFGIPASHRETLATPWSDASANPYDDILRWVETIETDQGIRPSRALTSRAVVTYLLKNDKMRELYWGRNFNGQVRPALRSLDDLNEMLGALELPTIATFDGKVNVENADGTLTLTRLTPQDRFMLLPDGPLGNLLIGTTAEALGMVEDGTINSEEAPGIWAGVIKESDPPVQYTKAAAVSFPTFPQADRVFLADVL